MCKVCKSWRNFIELSDFIFANATFHSGLYFKNTDNVLSNIGWYFLLKMINERKAYNCTTYLGRKQNFEKVLCNIKEGNKIEYKRLPEKFTIFI